MAKTENLELTEIKVAGMLGEADVVNASGSEGLRPPRLWAEPSRAKLGKIRETFDVTLESFGILSHTPLKLGYSMTGVQTRELAFTPRGALKKAARHIGVEGAKALLSVDLAQKA